MKPTIDLNYTNLVDLISPYKTSDRTESTAFLHWFLVNIYRLDEMEADDSICDGHGDKGIDAMYINHNEGLIDVFQSKIVKNAAKTLGDSQIKEFIGSLKQLDNDSDLNGLIQSTGNIQLRSLLEQNKEFLLSDDYEIRGVFVANAVKDTNADNLLKTLSSSPLIVWDKDTIIRAYVSGEKDIPETEELYFDVFGFDYAEFDVNNSVKVVIAPLAATDLVKMEGIDTQQIFELNLRKSLGSNKTKVNKDITASIKDTSEHLNFLLYHNGITVICGTVNTDERDRIKIKNYSIVNGCQSISCLYDNRDNISSDLRILARLIQVPSESELIPKITYNSNNQNGIKARDFRSNTATQVRLQQEIKSNYPNYIYQIKTGENKKTVSISNKVILDNTLVGQIMLAFDLKEPSRVQRPGRIFDDWHQEIFARPEVNGHRIISLFNIYKIVEELVSKVTPPLFGRYQITKFLLLYLLRQVLEKDDLGKDFCKSPEKYYQNTGKEKKTNEAMRRILEDLIIDLNAEFNEKGGDSYDFKTEFKNISKINDLSKSILSSYLKMVSRRRVETFSEIINSPVTNIAEKIDNQSM
ncbi:MULTISPECIES: AIPR family protein [unclassified Synechocystis]|uniref:AIPR family protein n=1 Tax=unclassified Synechocystis TaxID=2640012 RepID=UPI0003F9FDB6|nr:MULTISPECIES: AIPR family protein [unclassified Synechocystis]AIE72683.1 putative abortive infection phage resistance protein [Synechocystis sp. PCC 6714]MCT0254660.1 AIPR family protein [Synechocystis sp. CS-94]